MYTQFPEDVNTPKISDKCNMIPIHPTQQMCVVE